MNFCRWIFACCCMCSVLYAQHLPTEEMLVPKKSKIKSSIQIRKNNNDTLQIDTIVIVYKKKDTSVALKKYKGKIPQIQSTFNGFQNNDTVSVETMQHLLDSSLQFKDAKGNEYKVLSYRFCYRKKDVYIEDESMEVKIRYDLFCMQLQETPLPLKYKKNIQAGVQSAEQFWFENIIVQNPRGEKFLATNFSLITH